MRNEVLFAGLCCLVTSAVVATPKPPWDVPKSDWGGAEPINKQEWYTFEDYPLDAIKDDEQGFVTVAFTIEADGRMDDAELSDQAVIGG